MRLMVSFDLDDTAWKYRDWFRTLAHALKAQGHLVGILTGHGDGIRDADLSLWEARGFPPADFLYNADDIQRAGIVWHGVPQREAKTAFARQQGIHIHFDDFGCNHDFQIECWITPNVPEIDWIRS